MSVTIPTKLEGFTPVIDDVVHDVGLFPALIYGLVWRHCQMRDGVCKKSVDNLADMVRVSSRTVRRYLDDLVEKGYIENLTPGKNGKPNEYRIVSQPKIEGKMTVNRPSLNDDQPEGRTQSPTTPDSESYPPRTQSPTRIQIRIQRRKKRERESRARKPKQRRIRLSLSFILKIRNGKNSLHKRQSRPLTFTKNITVINSTNKMLWIW